MKISFVKLGHEECEQCAIFDKHNPSHNKDNLDETCDHCLTYMSHKLKYTETREEYKKDGELAHIKPEEVFYSLDLQKVIMLPRIDQYKAGIFCTRVITFNESFVPIGNLTRAHVPFAALWNECVSGRNQEDIISTFRAFLIYKRDAEYITLWLDNCAAQNKNWALLSFLVNIINSNMISAKTITLKYFEPGHTFMSADSFHHQVEEAMRDMKKVYDYSDFVECVQKTSSRKTVVKNMNASDFYMYQDGSSQHKLRKLDPKVYLKDIVAVRVERGSFNLKYKKSHGNEAFQELDFLQTKIIKNKEFPNAPQKVERGIAKERKQEIIGKLVPLMPENRRSFWLNLPVSDAPDLAITAEE